MTRSHLAVAAAIGAIVLAAWPATAGAWSNADTVRLGFCAANGGHWTVSGGLPLNVRSGWSAKNYGLLNDFMSSGHFRVEVTRVTGATTIDTWGVFDTSFPVLDGLWQTFLTAPTGVVLDPGETATFTVSFVVSHPLPDVVDVANPDAPPLVLQPGVGYYPQTCIVTAT
jgi:hypothetical protein